MTKQEQRAAGKAARKNLPTQVRKTADKALCAAVAGCDAFRRAHTVLLYHAVGAEADICALTQCAPEKVFAFPYCPAQGCMEAYAPATAHEWTTDQYGIPAPDPARARCVPPEQIDLVLVPGTAFDRSGGRVGMGAGVYDRYLQRCPQAFCVGVAYAVQLVERVAAQPWDKRMDAVATEQGITLCAELLAGKDDEQTP